MFKKIWVIWLGVVMLWLLIIQVDALSWYHPRFEIRASQYLTNSDQINTWKNQWVLPDSGEVDTSPEMQYNYATMLAQQAEISQPDSAVRYREESLEHYQKLLEQQENKYAVHNKNIIEQLLQDIQDQQQNQESQNWQDSNQQNQWSQDTPTENTDSSQSQQSQDSNQQEVTQQDADSQAWWSQEQNTSQPQESWLSEQQLQQLRQYQQQLEQNQFQNQQYFGKNPQDTEPSSVFEQFFGGPQYRQWDTWQERDW